MIHIKDREHLAEIDLKEPDYSFDLLGLWRDSDNKFYLGTDSGCSCPSPWESHTADDLTGPLTLDQAVEEATNLWRLAGKYEPEAFAKFLNTALTSFMTDVDTRHVIEWPSDVPERAHEVTDANGVEWEYLDGWMGDYASASGETRDCYSMAYPLTVKET